MLTRCRGGWRCRSAAATLRILAGSHTRQASNKLPSDSAAIDEDVVARLRLRDVATWRHAAREPDIAADRRPPANRNPAKNRRTGIDHNIIFNNGMPVASLEQGAIFIHREPLGTQRHALIQPHMFRR